MIEYYLLNGLLVPRVFGENSVQFKSISKIDQEYAEYIDSITQVIGLLRSSSVEYANGYLFDVKKLIEAEVFDDFLEQAEHLLNNGYYQPAAVIAGSVLDDGLRKLCTKQSITLPVNPKLDSMNAELAKSGLYEKLRQKRITEIADIRNKAAHGKWDKFVK